MGKLDVGILKRFVDVLPLDETYFVVVDVPENLRPNRELIKLNYSNLSIFENGDFIFLKEKKRLLIWFTDTLLNKKVAIPEAYLIYEAFKDRGEAVIIRKVGDRECILVIKDKTLKAQFCRKGELKDKYLEVVRREFSLKNPQLIKLDSNFKVEVSFLTISKFFKSSGFSIKSVLLGLAEDLKIPAIIILIIVNILDISIYEYVNFNIKKDNQRLMELKIRNKDIMEKFGFLKSKSQFFGEFISKNLTYPTVYETLAFISDISYKDKTKLHMYSQYERDIRLDMLTKSTSKVVKDLLSSNLFKNVEILSTSQYSIKEEHSRLRLTLEKKSNAKR